MRCYIVLALLASTQILPTEGVNIGENCDANSAGCPTNAACAASGPCSCNNGYTPKSDKTGCLANVGTSCVLTGTTHNCIPNAACTTTATPCACTTGYTKSSDSTQCMANVGTSCVLSGTTHNCIPNAACTTTATPCACTTGYTKSSDSTQCNSAVAGVASLVLVLVAFVTSRFL